MCGNGLEETVSTVDGSALRIDEDLCLNLRGRNLFCYSCATACPAAALRLSADAITIDEARCTGCGACLPVCPAGVLSLSSFAAQSFLDAIANHPHSHIHCSASHDKDGGVVVPCHTVLDARLFAAAMARGSKTLYLHGLERCGDCPKGNAMAHVARQRARLHQWFGAEHALELAAAPAGANMPDSMVRRENQPHQGRRQFLSLAGAQALTLSGITAGLAPTEDTALEKEPAPFFQNAIDRQRPAAYQALLAEHADTLPWLDYQIPWQGRTLTGQCSACLACALRCPTGALQAEETETSRAITFDLSCCTSCGLCERICPMQAVQPHPVTGVAALDAPRTVLMVRQQRGCARCGHRFAPEAEHGMLCPACRNEQALNEQWLAMLRD